MGKGRSTRPATAIPPSSESTSNKRPRQMEDQTANQETERTENNEDQIIGESSLDLVDANLPLSSEYDSSVDLEWPDIRDRNNEFVFYLAMEDIDLEIALDENSDMKKSAEQMFGPNLPSLSEAEHIRDRLFRELYESIYIFMEKRGLGSFSVDGMARTGNAEYISGFFHSVNKDFLISTELIFIEYIEKDATHNQREQEIRMQIDEIPGGLFLGHIITDSGSFIGSDNYRLSSDETECIMHRLLTVLADAIGSLGRFDNTITAMQLVIDGIRKYSGEANKILQIENEDQKKQIVELIEQGHRWDSEYDLALILAREIGDIRQIVEKFPQYFTIPPNFQWPDNIGARYMELLPILEPFHECAQSITLGDFFAVESYKVVQDLMKMLKEKIGHPSNRNSLDVLNALMQRLRDNIVSTLFERVTPYTKMLALSPDYSDLSWLPTGIQRRIWTGIELDLDQLVNHYISLYEELMGSSIDIPQDMAARDPFIKIDSTTLNSSAYKHNLLHTKAAFLSMKEDFLAGKFKPQNSEDYIGFKSFWKEKIAAYELDPLIGDLIRVYASLPAMTPTTGRKFSFLGSIVDDPRRKRQTDQTSCTATLLKAHCCLIENELRVLSLMGD